MSGSLIDQLAKKAIQYLQSVIRQQGFNVHVHFELEGCCHFKPPHSIKAVDFETINQQLAQRNIDGVLVSEYWKDQWEFVSLFNGQSPLKEAENLTNALNILPHLFTQYGAQETLIKPVVWGGDHAMLASGSKQIFTQGQRAIHIPNAIQVNVSVTDVNGTNLISEGLLGEYLQQCLMATSLDCCLLFLPEEEAFERLKLKSDYGLNDELCSPNDISGGHQGSIALYRQFGKHNQRLGEKILVVDHKNETLVSDQNWQETSRIEHRLGAASIHYNAYVNVVYVLLNVWQALMVYLANECHQKLIDSTTTALPSSLYDGSDNVGAISYFEHSQWFNHSLNELELAWKTNNPVNLNSSEKLGDALKQAILSQYQLQSLTLS